METTSSSTSPFHVLEEDLPSSLTPSTSLTSSALSPQLTPLPTTTAFSTSPPLPSVLTSLLQGNAPTIASVAFGPTQSATYPIPLQPRGNNQTVNHSRDLQRYCNDTSHYSSRLPHHLQGFHPSVHAGPPVNMPPGYGYGYYHPPEPYYPGFPGAAYYHPPFPPMPTAPPLHPYTAPPMMAPNFLGAAPPVRHFESVEERLCRQIEYYFSDVNLESDVYLKKQMDREGWVKISEIANFNRVKRLTNNLNLIKEALRTSHHVEVRDDKMRKRWGWNKWILL